jgi:outer membrane protein assembly factor BamB
MNSSTLPSSRLRRSAFIISTGALLLLAAASHSEDWPRWRGPGMDGISKETGWRADWSASPPKTLWKARIGEGFGSMTVADGRLFVVGLDKRSRKEFVRCLDAETGKERWSYSYPARFKPQYYEGGTSGTPTVDGDTVYFLEQTGRLFSFDAATGKLKWGQDVGKAAGSELGVWGLTGAPLVHGELLILNVGSAGAAVNKRTGKLVWKSSSAKNGYATPVPFKQGGKTLVGIFSSGGLAAVDPKNGKVAWTQRWKTKYDVNAADPVLVNDSHLYISSGYGTGGAMLQLTGNGAKVVWQSKDLRTQFNPAVHLDGHLYGIDGDTSSNRATLVCIDARTGRGKWKSKPLGSGGGVMAADGKLIVLSARGELSVGAASPTAFQPSGVAQVFGGKSWTNPVLANGLIYCRNSRGDLVCVDVKG